MTGRQWKALAMAAVTTMALSACAGGDETAEMEESGAAEMEAGAEMAVNLPEGVTQEQFDQGKQLFTGRGGCQACHGPDAMGTQLAPDLTDDEWINVSGPNYDEVVELIYSGVPQPVQHPGPMPPMGGASLTDAQVEALAAYVVGIGQG